MRSNYCIFKNNAYLCTRNRERLTLIKINASLAQLARARDL